ncbi:multiheme c-type cytochrome [Pinibacter soli]|uniref:Multiheme c-type cytochrome n=1 Tax=Pinibacter soli TaxID=3044211 RepID=A0ABT6RHK8_9BACT|nr:multiheme c-type cytochrome [Pinibacter soli]MDI3322061.1 multiheme c-type cytochrome [Pinibacter soli]
MKIASTTLALILLAIALYRCVDSTRPATAVELTYVGTAKCKTCHQSEYDRYLTSDHFHAMDSALPRSVKGNFDNATFISHGDTSFFYKKNDRYFVRTTDSSGKKKEFAINYTFGWKPLQQYLVQFPDGRIQTLPFCWDTRPSNEGGQRWFHIYGKENILPGDELFWTGINQNWNFMCADCHTTAYSKNYDFTANTYHSTWTESKVSCESCHGPASGHINWADKRNPYDSLKGFAINVSSKKVNWVFNQEKGIAYPSKVEKNDVLIETCARCHARASRVSDNYHQGASFLQTHIPSTINTNNYYEDGQIKEEDYEYGSFLQSKMYAQGVTCMNCHDPHTMQIKIQGNALCYSCHAPEKFDVEEHTHHEKNSIGATCVGCHMPTTNYMVIDARRDHSIRIPRPDLSESMHAPNACNKCHTDKTIAWSTKIFEQWYGDKLSKQKTYGELRQMIARDIAGSDAAWNELMSMANYPAIIKATALETNNRFYSQRSIDQITAQLKSSDPNLRLNALRAISPLPSNIAQPVVLPLLNDEVLTVRREALNVLLPFYAELPEADRRRFDAVMNEAITMERNLSDRPEGYLNQGILFAGTGKLDDAEQVYLLGIKRFPKNSSLYMNLADLYRMKQNEVKVKETLDKGLQIFPRNGGLHYALALWHVRRGDKQEGVLELQKAIQLEPSNASFNYGYAVAMHDIEGGGKAVALLESFTKTYGNDPSVINGLISFYNDMKQQSKVEYYSKLRKDVFGY